VRSQSAMPDSRAGTVRRARRFAAAVVVLACSLSGLLAGSASASTPLAWSAATSTNSGHALAGVSCASSGLCVAVDGTASANAIINTSPTTDTWVPKATGASHALAAVSCPSTGLCVAVGALGTITASTNPTAGAGSTWVAPSTLTDTQNLTSVSCPSTSFCLAVDAHGDADYSNNPSQGAGATWTVITGIDSTNHLNGVSCITSSFCAAVDTTGGLYTSTTPTSPAWTHSVGGTGSSLVAISCTTSGTCVAASANGQTLSSANATSAAPDWTIAPVDSGAVPTAVSCTAEAFCVIVDAGGYALESDNPAAAQPSWSSAQPDGGGSESGVSCIDAGLCSAVDLSGNAFTAVLPAPTVATGVGTAASQTVVTLTGTVNPNDAALGSCVFNYGTTTSYGSTAPCSSAPSVTGGAQAVSAQISGLTAGTTYHFEIVATTGPGASAGSDAAVTTLAALKPAAVIVGTPALGQTLTCSLGVVVPAGVTVTYLWVRDGTVIAGATAGTYLVGAADKTHYLYCRATISGDGGTETGQSNYVAIPDDTLGTVGETSFSAATATGHKASVTVICSPQAVAHCKISLRLTASEKAAHGRHVTVTVGSSSATIATGASAKLTVSLNAAGNHLLARKHHLATTLDVSGTIVGVIKAKIGHEAVDFGAVQATRHAA
jgi:hypothetical protein